MKSNILLGLLVLVTLYLAGCGKVGLKDPVFLPGLAEMFSTPTETPAPPKFNNGDVVRYKMLGNKQGIMMQCDYKYVPRLRTWYCIVDFYPSSALIHFDFSQFDNYERRYVYEYELELVRGYTPEARIPARWRNMGLLVDRDSSS